MENVQDQSPSGTVLRTGLSSTSKRSRIHKKQQVLQWPLSANNSHGSYDESILNTNPSAQLLVGGLVLCQGAATHRPEP